MVHNTMPRSAPVERNPTLRSGRPNSQWREVRKFLLFGGAFFILLTVICIKWIDIPLAVWIHEQGLDRHLWMRRFLDIPIVVAPLMFLYVIVYLASAGRSGSLRSRQWYVISLTMLVALQVRTLLKIFFGRTWPRSVQDVVVGSEPVRSIAESTGYLNDGVHMFNFFGGAAKPYAAFPSGSTTALIAVLIPVGFIYRRASFALATLGVISLASYVITNTHYLGDIIFGLFVGACCGICAVAHLRELQASA